MLLNRVEFALMNNPIRAAVQRRLEGPRLLRLGGPVPGDRALEIGCGRGVGVQVIGEVFGAGYVDAFDLDPRMIRLARERLRGRAESIRLWVGDATAIPAPSGSYDAVFDFGIVHHVPQWRQAIAEVARVLKPGGRFYAEEVLKRFVLHPLIRRVLRHPVTDRFNANGFVAGLEEAGLTAVERQVLWGGFGWFVAKKPAD